VSVEPGQKLSHYRLVEQIGQGGMGVVWKALDTQLNRHVAVKLLPPDVAHTPERRTRFQREAQAAAALKHPNIAVIHGVGEQDDIPFLVMELVEGKTLRELAPARPREPRDALRPALRIAEGLAHAHASGIVHRDLKPDNVMVADDGQVKILDFGLVKILEPDAPPPAEGTKVETISEELTRMGKVLGTVTYMSPEQARGLPVDSRTDLFSYGVLLYELLAGKPPFEGETQMDTLTSIIRSRHAPVTESSPGVPVELERIVSKCLEKNPADRYQDTRDLVVDLRRLRRETDSAPVQRAETSGPAPIAAQPTRRGADRWIIAAVAIVALVAIVFGLRPLFRDEPPPAPELRPQQLTSNPDENPIHAVALSPDGKYLAYADYSGIFLRLLSTNETHPLEMDDGFCFL
jgi:serine/threonine protein kinase